MLENCGIDCLITDDQKSRQSNEPDLARMNSLALALDLKDVMATH